MADQAKSGGPRYLLCPGMVTSRADGQRHYIGPMRLAQLYGVAPRDCLIYEPEPWWPASFYEQAEERHRGMVKLTPREDGDYSLPESKEGSRDARTHRLATRPAARRRARSLSMAGT